MLLRIVSGVVAAVLLAAVLFLPPYAIAITVFIAACIGMHEYARALKAKDIHIDLGTSYAATGILVINAYVASSPKTSDVYVKIQQIFNEDTIYAIIYIIIVFLFSRILFENGRCKLNDIAYTIFGIIYIPFLLAFAVMIRNLDYGFVFIWMVIIGGPVTDISAYFTGIFFGKHKIIPEISPKKTVEGSVGGALGCMLAMILYGIYVVNQQVDSAIPVYHFAIMGFLCGVVSQIGDWAASAIKRWANVKDFGRLIPGHGGILDRVDSILFVAPLIYLYIKLYF